MDKNQADTSTFTVKTEANGNGAIYKELVINVVVPLPYFNDIEPGSDAIASGKHNCGNSYILRSPYSLTYVATIYLVEGKLSYNGPMSKSCVRPAMWITID